jgi:hypothetical protein
MQIPFFHALEHSRRVLISGCGGGFDVVSGLPLYAWVKAQGKDAFLANLSFSQLGLACREKVGSSAWIVDHGCEHMSYFPERHLVDWLALRGDEPTVIGFERTGTRPLRHSYEAVVERLGIDTIILIDGGTDSVIKGDEALLGTVEEDAASIVAVDQVVCARKFLACLGFGIDQFHGICHHSFLENTAELTRRGGFLGCVSVSCGTAEGDAMLDAVNFLNERQPGHKSIVSNSIVSAMRGEFGDSHATQRTAGSELFINTLMSLYWCYDLAAVAANMGFYEAIADTRTFREVDNAIRLHHARTAQREWKILPL